MNVPARLHEVPLADLDAAERQHEEVVLATARAAEADGQHDAAVSEEEMKRDVLVSIA